MKQILLLSATFLALIGCGSANKKQTAAKATPPAASAPAMKAEKAAAASSMGADKVTCSKGKDERVLEVVKKDAGCGLNYTKAGATSEIAKASHGPAYCQEAQKKLQGKLEAAGYKCGP